MLLRFFRIVLTFLYAAGVATASSSTQAPALDTQYGEGKLVVHLREASVDDGVLTMVLQYALPPHVNGMTPTYAVDDVYILAGGKKYAALKDAQGNYLANHTRRFGVRNGREHAEHVNVHVKAGSFRHVWFLFPAPPDGVTQVQLQVPGISPFDFSID